MEKLAHKMSSSYPVLDNRPIDQWKVTELKEELKRRKLTTRGLKEDLVKRLDEAIRNDCEIAKENIDNGFDTVSQHEVVSKDADMVPFSDERARDTIDHGNNRKEIDGGMFQVHMGDNVASLGEGEVQEEIMGGTDSARNEELIVHAASEETTVTVTESVVPEIESSVQESQNNEIQNDSGDLKPQIENKDQKPPLEMGGTDSSRNEELIVHAASLETTVTVTESVVPVIESSVQESQNNEIQNDSGDLKPQLENKDQKPPHEMGGTDSARNEGLIVHAASVETTVTVTESVVPEMESSVQESQNNEIQNGSRDLGPQLENKDPKPPQEDVKLNSSDPNNQVSEVSPVLGFQVKSDSVSSDCVSINEKNELKDNIIADNVKLELDVRPEMVQPSFSNVVADGGKLHPMDVEEPRESKVSVEERDDNNAANREMSKKNDSADVGSSEKLNLDRSSGEDSMEEDALESKQIDSKYNTDEVGDRSEKTEVHVVKEDGLANVMRVDIPADKKDSHGENKKALAAAPTVKRKLHDQAAVGNNETPKRRRWNSESLKVLEPQSINLASSSTPKDKLPSTTLKGNFSRSDSTVSENEPDKRVVPPSPKPPTNSLRIDHFLRPFTLKAVQEFLGKTGTVTSFWMDHIKTHCYVTYSSVEEAIETRNAVHNLQWPPNGGRLLMAEFVVPEEVKSRVETPPQSASTPVCSGTPIPSASPSLPPQPSPRHQVQRQQLLPPPPLPPPPPLSNPLTPRERLPLPPPPPLPEKVDPPIVTLDDLFRKTKAMPRIYYLPLTDEQVKLKAQGKNVEK
ncbi:uncharacterized protein LOC132267243 [Cornus florida]|uniref:uncharacterized protein LOC132267243 n=1 Tax=Cornus florida TaxID=4283 RepID=UPI00289A2974|nr:uncharacterized protein LOC132267243 [Cornus florida]XP_059624328.1 uncharacterized protein LOC132267243 [Cornus florida]